MTENLYWTPQRREMLRDLWPQDLSRDEVKVRLDATPGPPIPLNQISVEAARLGVSRSDEFMRAVRVAASLASKSARAWTSEQMRALTEAKAAGWNLLEMHAAVNAAPGRKRSLATVLRVAATIGRQPRVRRKSICVKVPAGVLMQKKPAQQFVPRNVVVKRMEPPPTPVAFGSLKKHPRPFSMLGGAR